MLLGPVVDAPFDEWQRMIDLNVTGLLACTHAALPHLLAAVDDSPRGVVDIVNISSVAGRETRVGSAVYNATKHGVGAFSESLRQEFASHRLRVSLVEPGAVATELVSHNRPEIQEASRQRFQGVERMRSEEGDAGPCWRQHPDGQLAIRPVRPDLRHAEAQDRRRCALDLRCVVGDHLDVDEKALLRGGDQALKGPCLGDSRPDRV